MGNRSLYTLHREGTCQSERFPEALSDEYVKIDERSLTDLVRQSAEYAKYLKYYNERNIEVEDADWCAFFEEIYDYKKGQVKFSSIEELEKDASTSPHLALFLAFLRLFGIAQENLNSLTKKHLDYYYREILQIKPRTEIPDSVPLFFELSKPAKQVMVPAGTWFEAGKDKNGRALCYATKNDLIVNKAKVESVIDLNYNKEEVCRGFAIASPLFKLKDGVRRVVFTVKNGNNLSSFFKAEYSSEEGWVEAEWENAITIIIAAQKPPVVPYNESVHLSGLDTNLPVIRLLCKEKTPALHSADMTNITVRVVESKDFIVRGDHGILNHRQAFLPFGSNPVKGASLRIENAQIFNQFLMSVKPSLGKLPKLDKLNNLRKLLIFAQPSVISATSIKKTSYQTGLIAQTIGKMPVLDINDFNQSDWKGPDDLETYYKSYKAGVGLMSRRQPFDYSIKYDSLLTEWNLENATSGFIETTLNRDLGHSVFPNIFAAVALHNATNKDKKEFPKPPYTPEIKNITLSYDASAVLENFTTHEIFSLHPFGHVKLEAKEFLLNEIRCERELFFGISNIEKSSVLSLHLRLGDQVDNPCHQAEKTPPVWFYLEHNEWKPFEESWITGDSTQCFTRSGIVCLNIPQGAITSHTIMPDGKVWLKLVFEKKSDAFPTLEKIETQVVEASFVNQDNELSHLEKGIAVETISKPTTPLQGIKSIKQPYPSYGGRGIEDDKAYYTRVSERLRHKDRAWNVWDYERLILERFPEVFKVKCIPNTNHQLTFSPGDVFIVLIPDCSKIPQRDMYTPIVSQILIEDVRSFVTSHCSPFVNIHVDNPCYEQVLVTCKVAYTKECSDISFYDNRLNEDLKSFLTPWINDPAVFNFNRSFYKSQILYFIEKRPYVDYIENLTVQIIDKNGEKETVQAATDDEVIQPFHLNGILTTFQKHNINAQ